MSRPIFTAAAVAAAIVLVAVLALLFYPSATVPPDGRVVTDADRGDRAREEIAAVRERSEDAPVDYQEAFASAEAHREAGRLADAQVMYFFAARNGHARAAYRLGEAYDPVRHDPGTSLVSEPDASAAYRWYAQALDGGVTEATERLDALRDWAESQAQAGNFEAEQLLVRWD